MQIVVWCEINISSQRNRVDFRNEKEDGEKIFGLTMVKV